jgi:hypothetical protein
MPVWGEVISARQVADLVAYLRAGLPAVPGATPPPVITAQLSRFRQSTTATPASAGPTREAVTTSVVLTNYRM